MAVLPTNHMVLTRPRPRARPRCWRGTRCRRRAGPRRPPGGCSPWPRAGGWRPGPRWCWAGRSLGPCPEQCHRYQPCCVVRGDATASLSPSFPPQCQQPAACQHYSRVSTVSQQSETGFYTSYKNCPRSSVATAHSAWLSCSQFASMTPVAWSISRK